MTIMFQKSELIEIDNPRGADTHHIMRQYGRSFMGILAKHDNATVFHTRDGFESLLLWHDDIAAFTVRVRIPAGVNG